jgi:hypothetical protein
MVKKILISGASGFVGGILVEHLSKTANYDVYVMDKHIALSPRYQLENRSIFEEQRPILPLKEKFYVCDITDKNQLSRIIQDNQINNECDLIYTDRLMNLQSKLMIKMMIHFRVFVRKNLQQHTRIRFENYLLPRLSIIKNFQSMLIIKDTRFLNFGNFMSDDYQFYLQLLTVFWLFKLHHRNQKDIFQLVE